MKIFTLIPAFNERENLPILIDALEKQFEKQKVDFKIFFVLQGDDGSRQYLIKLKQKKPFVDFFYSERPLGIGFAYKIGYGLVDKSATHILTMDADLNHDIADLPKFIKSLNGGKIDLVIGSRFITGGKFDEKRKWKKLASLLTNRVVSKILGIKIRDISSGFRLMKKEVADRVSKKLKYSGYPSYMEFILLTNRYGFNISEIPITYHHRVWGKSKISSFKTMIDYCGFLIGVILNSFQHLTDPETCSR